MACSSTLPYRTPKFLKPHHFEWNDEGWFCKICRPDVLDYRTHMSASDALKHEQSTVHIRRQHHEHSESDDEPCHDDDVGQQSTRPPLTVQGLKKRELRQRWSVDQVRDIVPWWVKGIEAAERGENLRMEELIEKLALDPWNVSAPDDDDDDAYARGWGGAADGVNGNDWAADAGTGWGDAVGRTGAWSGAQAGGANGNDWAMNTPSHAWARDGSGKPASRRGWHAPRPKDSATISSLHAPRTVTASDAETRKKRQMRIVARAEETMANKYGKPPQRQKDIYRFVDEVAQREAADDEKRRKMHMFLQMSTQEQVRKIQETIRHLRT